ncbi:MAG: protoporphyrinogen oxidase [Anaerolineales bacterium]|nr:protoporphyrinogen oxidase [Anaerolineales bacterium]
MIDTANNSPQVVIIGGGITGLSAAWYLQTRSTTNIRVTLIEASEKLGGKMITHKLITDRGKFIIDAGPESFVTRKPEAWDLAVELGLENEIINPGGETRNMYVLDGGEPKKIPLSPPAFITSNLLTLKGKLRMMAEPLIPARRDDEDESLASFVSRRLGQEALEKMIGPVLAGIYNTNPETQSIMTTSPIMREMEKEYGGLFRGALGRMHARRKQAQNGPHRPQFMTYKSGAQVMMDALREQLRVKLITGSSAEKIIHDGNGYQVSLIDHDSVYADAVILATPANQTSKLLADLDREVSALIGQIDHQNIGTATLIFNSSDLSLPYEINGLMIPRREKRRIDAITWTTNKPMVRGPEGFDMLRVFFGGGDPSLATMPEDEIVSAIRLELKDILGIEAAPVFFAVFCWPESFPQAYVGHQTLVDQIEQKLPPGIFVAGSSYRGIGIPDCIRQGRDTARQALEVIKINFN